MTDNLKLEKIIETLKIVLKTNDVNQYSEMGSPSKWNSLTHVEIILELEKIFKQPIELHQLYLLTSVKKIDHFLKS